MRVQLRRQLFLAVRNLPYRIGNKATDTSCVAKTKLLGELLTRAGLECQVWKAVMRWSDTNIPEQLVEQAPRPTFNHLFLKVKVPETGHWVVVDSTWDSRFDGQLPVNTWDGLTDTVLAYPSKQCELVGSVHTFEFRDFNPDDAFTKQLNAWYESLVKGRI